MLNFTDTAKSRITSFLDVQRSQGVTALRVAGNRAEYKLWLVKESDKQATDHVFKMDGFEVYIDPLSFTNLSGATVDFVDSTMQSGFRIFYPSPTWSDPLEQRVQDVLDQHINPGVAGHGGSVSLSRVEGDTAYITMGGGCQGCASSQLTLKMGVEWMIKENVPEIQNIVDVTDHDAGENPYYNDEHGESPVA
ncbi:MAG: NifU family protein [Trueperaceae bacterium]